MSVTSPTAQRTPYLPSADDPSSTDAARGRSAAPPSQSGTTLVAVNPPEPQAAAAALQRIGELNQRVEAAPLVLPAAGEAFTPRLPAALANTLDAGERTWRGVAPDTQLTDRSALAEVGRFLVASGLAKGLPANWTPEQRDRFASLLVLSVAAVQSRQSTLQRLRQDLPAILSLVNGSRTRLPVAADSNLNTGVDTRPLKTLPGLPEPTTQTARQLDQRITKGDIAAQLASADPAAGRKAYTGAYALVRALPTSDESEAADQRTVASNLDRQYLSASGRREALVQQARQGTVFAAVARQLQDLPPQAAQPLRGRAQAVLDASRDVGSVAVAQKMFHDDTNAAPVLQRLALTLSTGQVSVDRESIKAVGAQADQRLQAAQEAWSQSVRAASTPAPVGATPPQPPRQLAQWQKAAGEVSMALTANIFPYLREIEADKDSKAIRVTPFDFSANREQVLGEVAHTLIREGGVAPAQASSAAASLVQIAEGLDIDAPRLAVELGRRVAEGNRLVASVGPHRPLLIASDSPTSLKQAEKYFTALYSQGIVVPEHEVDSEGHRVTVPAKLVPTSTMSDQDGVYAMSYGENAAQLKGTLADGRAFEMYLRLDTALKGVPTEVLGLHLRPDSQSAVLDVKVRDERTGRVDTKHVSIPINQEQASLLLNAKETRADSLEGLTARFFPPEAMRLLQAVSDRNGRGGQHSGSIASPRNVGNTFGTAGEGAPTADKPGEYIQSVQHSLPPYVTMLPLQPGLQSSLPHFKIYSGGAAVTLGPKVQEPFGLDPADVKGIKTVASQLNGLVDELGKKYGLTAAEIADWHRLNFTNADIPSIILPASVVGKLSGRGDTRAGNGLRDLQLEIETRIQRLIRDNHIEETYRVHHTPSTGDDEVAPVRFDEAGKPMGKFTTEWQINVKSGKALPVLDDLAGNLKTDFGIDLLGELRAAKYDYKRIRTMELPEVIAFFRQVVRPLIDDHERKLGHKLTGRMVVQADTYSETTDPATGKKARGGSDKSMIDAIRALYGDANTVIVQVDTAGGKAMAGRDPAFAMQTNPATGLPTLQRPAIDPTSEGAVDVYVDRPESLGRVQYPSYMNQFPAETKTPVTGASDGNARP